MKIIRKHKQIIALATLFSIVFGFLVVCHSYFIVPVSAATVSDEVVNDITDNSIINLMTEDFGVCRDEQVPVADSPITPSHHKNHQRDAGGLMPCCYEKAPPSSSNLFKLESLVKTIAPVLVFNCCPINSQLISSKVSTHGPPISAAELSRIITKRE